MFRVTLLTAALAVSLVLCSPVARAQQEYDTPPQLPAFEFHSGFWINLHHFLYLQGRLRSTYMRSAGAEETPRPEFATVAATDGLTPDQLRAWNAAVDVYAKDWSSRDLLRNSEMTLINNRLAELETCTSLMGKPGEACTAGLNPELVGALDAAASAYRVRWWPEQDRENRAWIASVAPLVRRYGADLSAQLVDTYQRRWPPGALRIDVVWYAGPLGAYTSLEPTHVTIASHDARNQEMAAFEVLYHESSYTLAVGINEAIEAECRRRGVPIPRDLWHALVYYTTGELVRRILANAATSNGSPNSLAGYTPYVDRFGVYDREWNNYQQLLKRYWQPYLDGRLQFDSAISRIIASL